MLIQNRDDVLSRMGIPYEDYPEILVAPGRMQAVEDKEIGDDAPPKIKVTLLGFEELSEDLEHVGFRLQRSADGDAAEGVRMYRRTIRTVLRDTGYTSLSVNSRDRWDAPFATLNQLTLRSDEAIYLQTLENWFSNMRAEQDSPYHYEGQTTVFKHVDLEVATEDLLANGFIMEETSTPSPLYLGQVVLLRRFNRPATHPPSLADPLARAGDAEGLRETLERSEQAKKR